MASMRVVPLRAFAGLRRATGLGYGVGLDHDDDAQGGVEFAVAGT